MYRNHDEIREIEDFFDGFDWQWISRDERKWWKAFCFHHTDLSNIPTILELEHLYSRSYLELNGIDWYDIGSQVVLERTNGETLDSVRFYFRPRTPTQFHIEGIKSRVVLSQSQFKEHCPIPVFLLFDIVDILSRKKSQFSDGNLGSSQSNLYTEPSKLKELPWQLIYHKGSYNPQQQSEIKRHRCAEIIVPEKVDLNGLKYIFCRSEAEKETLLNLLQKNQSIFDKYSPMITSSGKYDLFEKRYTFIEKVDLGREIISVFFYPESQSPGPFDLKAKLSKNNIVIKTQEITKTFDDLTSSVNINVPLDFRDNYTIELYLDEYLVYKNSFEDPLFYLDDIIF